MFRFMENTKIVKRPKKVTKSNFGLLCVLGLGRETVEYGYYPVHPSQKRSTSQQ